MKTLIINSKTHGICNVLLDDEDYENVIKHKWFVIKTGKYVYAARWHYGEKNIMILLHRMINKTPIGFVTDHKNRNSLDNQKHNLRTATVSQNAANIKSQENSTSQFLGVYWETRRNKWFVTIKSNKKNKFIGRFDEEVEAAKAYDKAAIECHGEFANLNFK